jgi:hypothetical protein
MPRAPAFEMKRLTGLPRASPASRLEAAGNLNSRLKCPFFAGWSVAGREFATPLATLSPSSRVQIPEDGSDAYADRLGDFLDRQPLFPELLGAAGLGFGRAGLATEIDAPSLCRGDADSLTLTANLLLHLGDAEQHGGEHLSQRAIEVDLLRRGDDPQPLVAPVREYIDAVSKAAGEPVEFPTHNSLDLAVENVLLEPLECRPVLWLLGVPGVETLNGSPSHGR